jgi:tRNA(fMet)-specific endonuclease VapC
MKYLLDTNVCIQVMRGKHPTIAARLHDCAVAELAISAITLSELRHGAEKSADPLHHHALVSRLLTGVTVLPFDFRAADKYGELRADLERRGQLIGSLDMLLAAHALSESLIFVTHNTSEFQRVKGLQLEDWYE